MSSCRCADIGKCKSQLDKLWRNLECVQICSNKSNHMEGLIEELISYNNNAFISLDSPDLNHKTQQVGDELIEIINEVKEKIEDRIQELRDTLERLEEEDEDFHSQEDEDMPLSLEEMQTK